MPKRIGGTPRSPGQEEGATPLPDLSGMGLCALRTSDDARVAAAVTWTLEHPARLRLFWAANEGGQGGDGTEGPDSRHSAALPSLPWYDRPERSDPANFRA